MYSGAKIRKTMKISKDNIKKMRDILEGVALIFLVVPY